ncbi:hypothetical protein [Streptomyces sp. SID3343]|nr:hypothetical protein [Streptomyces sp. SID3343]
MHLGRVDDDRLYLTLYKDGKWSIDEPLPEAHRTHATPAVAWA